MEVFKIIFLCVLIQLALVSGYLVKNNHGGRIIGGALARAGEFPYAAAVHTESSIGKFFCGGALINNRFVLTAGNCVINGTLFTIQLGSNYLNRSDPYRLTLATSTYFVHPAFIKDTIEHDIGLLRFREVIGYDDYIYPVSYTSAVLGDNVKVVVLGWGQIGDFVEGYSNQLRYVELTTISQAECQTYYGNQITDSMICVAGSFNEGTCTGDNGGPLMSGNILFGVASFISGNGCESVDPSGFTRLRNYYDWVNVQVSQYK